MILITMTIMVLGGRCRSFSSATTATNALLDRCQAVVELQTVPYTSNDDVALSLGDSRSWFDLSPRESFYALCTGLKLLLYPQYDGRAAVAMDSCACALETIIRTSLKYSTTDLHRQVVYTFIVFFYIFYYFVVNVDYKQEYFKGVRDQPITMRCGRLTPKQKRFQ